MSSQQHRAPEQPELVCVGLPVPFGPKYVLYLSLSLSRCVFVCYMQVFICVHMYRDQNLTFSIFLYHFLPYFWRQDLLQNLELTSWPASSEDLTVAVPLPPPTFPRHTVLCYRSIPQHPAFTWVLESEQVFMLA